MSGTETRGLLVLVRELILVVILAAVVVPAALVGLGWRLLFCSRERR